MTDAQSYAEAARAQLFNLKCTQNPSMTQISGVLDWMLKAVNALSEEVQKGKGR